MAILCRSNLSIPLFPTAFAHFPGGSDGKASVCDAGDPGSISGLGRSPGEFHRQRNLVGYGTWGHIELDTTE